MWPFRELNQLAQLRTDNAVLSESLRASELAREELALRLEYALADFRRLVDTAVGRITPRVSGPLDLNRDPFAEDESLPTIYVSDGEPDVDALGESLAADEPTEPRES